MRAESRARKMVTFVSIHEGTRDFRFLYPVQERCHNMVCIVALCYFTDFRKDFHDKSVRCRLRDSLQFCWRKAYEQLLLEQRYRIA